MKYLVFAALISISTSSYARESGINYDPAHSTAYISAQQQNNIDGMRAVINRDFQQIKDRNFNTIKTFYSQFCTINGQKCINITERANSFGRKILLGVYEFPDHADWTVTQVNAAINAAKQYPQAVVGIVVGNEDMFTWDGKPIPEMQKRIVADINTIKKGLGSLQIKVFTAQREPDWYALGKSDPYKVLQNTDVLGANIYPFWGNSPEKIDGKSVALKIPSKVEDLKTRLVKRVIVTEEGWPSCGNNPNTQDKTIDALVDYYIAWVSRSVSDNFDSYYFTMYDNKPQTNCPNDDANNHFGVCLADNGTKDKRIGDCK